MRHAHTFGRTLAEALVSSGYVRKNNNPHWVKFVTELPGVSYETLRKAVTGERWPSVELMKHAAERLHLEPTVFVEYRLWLAQTELDPSRVGWERAVDALLEWEAFRSRAATQPGDESET